LIFEVALDKVE
jgi:hypothetical protein